MTLLRQLLLGVIGLAAGGTIAAGVYAFLAIIGVFVRLIGKTGTRKHILLYETVIVLGGTLGNLVYVFGIGSSSMMQWLSDGAQLSAGSGLLGIFGIFSGIFVGCWAMALAEILNVFPVFMRRARIVRYIAAFTISVALGKGLGAGLFFFRGW